jgi:ABC-type multidrug transport system ATPase subunit
MAKLHEEGMNSQRILEEQDVFEIRREFTLDDKEEARKQRELRKQSLAMRLEAWREGKEVDRQDRDFQNVQKEENEILKEMDREAVREAKQQQQASEIEDILTSAFLV